MAKKKAKRSSRGPVRVSSDLSAHWVAQFWLADEMTKDKRKLEKSADQPIAKNERPKNRYQGGLTFMKGVTLGIRHSSDDVQRAFNLGDLQSQGDLTAWIGALKALKIDPTEGSYFLELIAHPDESCDKPAGPDIGTSAASSKSTTYDALWRPIEIEFKLNADFRVVTPTVTVDDGVKVKGEAPRRGKNGYVYVSTTSSGAQVIEIDWKPDWLRRIHAVHPMKQIGKRTGPKAYTEHPSPRNRGGQSIEAVVLHNTGGGRKEGRNHAVIGSAINQFTMPWATTKLKMDDNGNFIPERDSSGAIKKNAKGHTIFKKLGQKGFKVKAKSGTNGRGVPAGTGIHYVIDADGHVVKMLHEDSFANHTHTARWLDIVSSARINKRSVGIEHVLFKDNPDFPAAQIRASVDLVSEIKDAHGISPRCLMGHGDVRTTDDRLNTDDRRLCPGFQFPWGEYEKKGLALAADDDFEPVEGIYGGIFALKPKLEIALQDNKQRDSKLNYGNKKFWAAKFVRKTDESIEVPFARVLEVDGSPGTYVDREDESIELKRIDDPPSEAIAKSRIGPITAPVIRQLQDDLRRIGWAVSANGVYDRATRDGVRRFQGRFMLAGTSGKKKPGNNFTKEIAVRIKQVIAKLRADGDERRFAG